ncbi:efflux RND transporter periplasmic adaptor subunit [Thiomicrorhabdus arctica]|uniref:efflux RND transporter periplasmic adaptor subunit n=1 Tax=Thiomicrorhabdus arctica TaxID=131540 RepID=UPI00037EABF5|nr:efflux RND transporter periplasmic adaptor subunit [Thiomicrorhabdus arctica]
MKLQQKLGRLSMVTLVLTVGLYSTTLYAETVKVGALVAGQVSKVYVQAGQIVKKGDRLLTLDADRFQAKLNSLQAILRLQKAKLADAQIELDQALDLYERTVTSKRTRDAAQLAYDVASAAFQQAKADVALQQAWSKYTYIVAPVDGKVLKIHAPLGTTVYKENSPLIDLEI